MGVHDGGEVPSVIDGLVTDAPVMLRAGTGRAACGSCRAPTDREEVVAAVLVYGFLTYVLPIPLGVLSYVFWRRNRSWRRKAQPVLAVAG